MVKQNAVASLKESIRLVEMRQSQEGIILKEQFRLSFDSLKPINLIKSSINDLVSSVDIKNGIFESLVTIVSGYISQKFIVNSNRNILVKTLGVLMQFGVTNLISKNSENVRTFFSNLIQRLFNLEEEEENPEASDEKE